MLPVVQADWCLQYQAMSSWSVGFSSIDACACAGVVPWPSFSSFELQTSALQTSTASRYVSVVCVSTAVVSLGLKVVGEHYCCRLLLLLLSSAQSVDDNTHYLTGVNWIFSLSIKSIRLSNRELSSTFPGIFFFVLTQR